MNKTLADGTTAKSSPLVVELVGPAGAGKTTLSQALKQRSNRILLCTHPYFRRIEDIPFFTRNTLLLLPTFIHLYHHNNGRWLTRREMAWMVILRGWHRVLERQVPNSNTIVVLDQGPIYFLTELHGFGPENLKSQSANGWWDSTYKQWADTLDVVIWLDASDTTLVERIRTRDMWHVVKGKPAPEVSAFLARYRAAYEQVMSLLVGNATGPKVLRFDTTQESSDRIVDRILVLLGLKR